MERRKVLSVFLHNINMDGSFGSMKQFGRIKWLKTKGDMHNDPENPYHMSDPHELVVIGKSFDACFNSVNRVHLNMTTPSNLLNLLRAIASGWRITIAGDGLYGLCKNNFGMVIFSVVSF